MYRALVQSVVLVAVVAAGAIGIYLYHAHSSVEAQLERERERTAELRQIVQRLTAERRVADVMVTGQQVVDGVLRTSLVFVEYGRDDRALPAKRFTVDGKIVHFDAMVVKFDGKFVEQNDPLRGRSVALFTRLYGETQSPAQGFPVDVPCQVPEVYRDPDPKVQQFQRELWQNFWRLADDAEYRNAMGVRVAQGEGPWRPIEPDQLYTITLDANGGVNIHAEPLKGIYREAIKSSASTR